MSENNRFTTCRKALWDGPECLISRKSVAVTKEREYIVGYSIR